MNTSPEPCSGETSEVCLQEYGSAHAQPGGPHPALLGRYLDHPDIAPLVRGGALERKLGVSENRHGLCLRADRWVGVVHVGPVQVRIEPRLPVGRLWPLMAYALGLDGLRRLSDVQVRASGDFADLLAQALLVESERLWRSGLHRGYEEREAWLAAPTGRPDMAALAHAQPLTRAALPCRFHAFTTDVLANRVVLGGLLLARRMCHSGQLRSALHRAMLQWSARCTPVPLSASTFEEVERVRSRLTERYRTAHGLVGLLAAGAGLDTPEGEVRIPGFLWDMAALFERFVARFLAEHLPRHRVCVQVGLTDLYRVHKGPRGLRAPRPRPDLVLRDGERTLAVLDTKYADLWSQRPSREIVYQASVYALAWSGTGTDGVPAILLYPWSVSPPPDQELHLHVAGAAKARRIILRGVDWVGASELVWGGGELAQRTRLAQRWVELGTGGGVAEG